MLAVGGGIPLIVKEIAVRNYRSIKEITVPFDNLTVFVGPNGSGKSSILQAMNLFYTPKAAYAREDFYNEDITQPISVMITYSSLKDDEKTLFSKYVEGGNLTIEKVMEYPDSKQNQKYYGSRLRNPEFEDFRTARGSELRREYNRLKGGSYQTLPDYSGKETAEELLQEWEVQNPANCIREREEAQFFGFTEVGAANIDRFSKYIFIPAVRDASEDALEGKESSLTKIMELVVRSALRGKAELMQLKEQTQERYRTIMHPSRLTELETLQVELDLMLKKYIPTSGVTIDWNYEEEIVIPDPQASVRLTEDDYSSSVTSCGHGLQRAFILSMLHYLALCQSRNVSSAGGSESATSYIIAIEEPELYQHPNRQRYLSRTLLEITNSGVVGVFEAVQIVYTTHSPLFVELDRFDSIRKFRKKERVRGSPKESTVIWTRMDDIADIIGYSTQASPGQYSGETLIPRLQTLMTPWMNEGFFSDGVVLVEGEEDRAILLATAAHLGHDLEALGISIIPCFGKSKIDRPAAIFRQLDIPTYVIWDSDRRSSDSNPEENRRLLRLLDAAEEDWPDVVTDSYACFETTMNDKLVIEIGTDLFNRELESCCTELSYRKKYATKNPEVLYRVISAANEVGNTSSTITSILEKIVNLIA